MVTIEIDEDKALTLSSSSPSPTVVDTNPLTLSDSNNCDNKTVEKQDSIDKGKWLIYVKRCNSL